MNKAPSGGMTSAVNGQFYEGGEFMPDHGLYCGRGRNRVTKARFDEVAAMALSAGYELRFHEPSERFQLVKKGNCQVSAKRLESLLPVVQC